MRQTSIATMLHREPWPPARGRPGLAQGRYGAQGNVELVVPAVDDGLWVGWFNGDADDDRSTTRSRSWSGALRFGCGRSYVSADITQLAVGPGWLEVVALTDNGELVRHVWSPEHGFVEQPLLRTGVRDHSALVVAPDGCHHLALLDHDGVIVLSGQPTLTPRWEPHERRGGAGENWIGAAWHDDHLDVMTTAAGRTVVRCDGSTHDAAPVPAWARLVVGDADHRLVFAESTRDLSLTTPGSDRGIRIPALADSAAAASVTLDGQTAIHIVARRGEHLTHLRQGAAPNDGPDSWEQGRLEAEVWVPAGHAGTVHRGVT